MIVHNLTPGGYASNCYVVVADDSSDAIIIDPSMPPSSFHRQCPEIPLPTKILLTHANFDHMYALKEWYEMGIPVYVGTKELPALADSKLNCSAFVGSVIEFVGQANGLCDGDLIPLGDEQLSVIETPGHTVGGCCYYSNGISFSGDTLFADGSVGRTDLPGGSLQALKQSLKRLLDLPIDTRVFPGHNHSTTIEKERRAHLLD
jgi:glyoxylase-like metal-dependent hydrolase (beta-lactamase superfamily II)